MTAHGSTDRTRVARGDAGARRLPSVLGLRLRHLIGAGGEGEVWAAAAPGGAVRALKLIRPDVLADPETFARRSHDLAQIDDPALVRVHRAAMLTTGDWQGWGAMVMDLVDGPSLDHARLGAAAFAVLAPLATALDRLHAGEWSQGEPLVHRDVKPANLIRTQADDIVLVDPSSLRSVGSDMTFVGTPLFVAPEVVSGRFGPPADVYSFAATLIALHSGARGEGLAALLADPWVLDIPQAVIAAISVRPQDRPGRCSDLVDREALTVTVVSRAEPAPASSPDADRAPQTSRTWWRLGLLTAAAVPLFVGLLLLLPLVALAGMVVTAGLLAMDRTLRNPWLAWLPLACARWLAGTLQTDDAERDRISATVYGALLIPLLPLVGVVVGLWEQMVRLGTLGQIAGVLLICGLALVWATIITAGRAGSRLSLVRILLFPAWLAGMFALALARVVLALTDALSPDRAVSEDPQGEGEHDRTGGSAGESGRGRPGGRGSAGGNAEGMTPAS